jgi:hypothetical protein
LPIHNNSHPSLSLSLSLSHSVNNSLAHTHTHTHTLSLSLSSFPLSPSAIRLSYAHILSLWSLALSNFSCPSLPPAFPNERLTVASIPSPKVSIASEKDLRKGDKSAWQGEEGTCYPQLQCSITTVLAVSCPLSLFLSLSLSFVSLS